MSSSQDGQDPRPIRRAHVRRQGSCWLVYRPVSRFGSESTGRQCATRQEVEAALESVREEARAGGWDVDVSEYLGPCPGCGGSGRVER